MELSVITPVAPASLQFLEEAAKSVESLRSEILMEWVICIDGSTELTLPNICPAKIIKCPSRWGVAGARNIGLSHAKGKYILPLDADDMLVPEGVMNLISILKASKSHGWIAGNRIYFDSTLTPHWISEDNEYAISELSEHWTSPFPFHPNCLIFERSLGLRVGGWPALLTNEDLGFVLALNRISPGLVSTNIILRYRSWDGQTIKNEHYNINKYYAFNIIQSIENQWRKSMNLKQINSPIITIPEVSK